MTSFTGIIVERAAPRLCTLADDAVTPGIRLLNRPLVDHQLALMRQYGVCPMRPSFHAGTPMKYSEDDVDAGTGRSVLVVAGDVLTDADLSAMLRFHAEHSPGATVMLSRAPRRRHGRIIDATVERRIIDGGVAIVEASHLGRLLARRTTISLSGVLAALLAEELTYIGWYSGAYARRIHTPVAYHAAHMDLLCGRVSTSLDPPGRPVNGNWLGDDVTIAPDATVEPPSVIGARTEIGVGARVGPRAVVGAHGRLGSDVRVTESILGEGVFVGESAILDGCVVGSGARVGPFSILAPGAVAACGAVLRSRTLLPR